MPENAPSPYHILDRPDVLRRLFHPRPEMATPRPHTTAHDALIPVASDISIGARFHMGDTHAPTILFFHGNGEIVSDYDDLGPLYVQRGINFIVVDYRGYGRSSGIPTVTAMMADCHLILKYVRRWLNSAEHSGPLIVMGRSLGSASALELASQHQNDIEGLIIESGFAAAGPLLTLLGIDIESIGFKAHTVFQNVAKISRFTKPTLVIHAEFDHIIPFTDGQSLYNASTAAHKFLLKIPGANHNDIFMRGLNSYLEAVDNLVRCVQPPPS